MSTDDLTIPKLTPNVPRIIASIFRALTVASNQSRTLSQYDIVKTLFLADREHLNEWGRPITYDNYVAMKHGPVPSLAYNLLKANAHTLRTYRITSLPWKSSCVAGGNGRRSFSPVDASFEVEDYLSESDLEAIDHALSIVLRLGFGQVRRLTHEDPAYVDAWREDGDRAAYDMRFGLLFEEPDFERAEFVAEQSSYV